MKDAIVRDGIVRAARERVFEVRQVAVLILVAENPDYSVRDLAAALDMSKPAATRALARLG